MIPVLIALGAAGLAGHHVIKRRSNGKPMSPDREKIFNELMATAIDPAKLRGTADVFEKEGLKVQAQALRKRAALREQTPELKKQRRFAFRKAMGSTDPVAVEGMAKVHEEVGAWGAAAALRQHAKNLKA